MDSVEEQPASTQSPARLTPFFKGIAWMIGIIALLWLTCTSPYWIFMLGLQDSSRVARYKEFLATMSSELQQPMPPSVPAGASGARFHYHAGMLQAKPWLELRFVVPIAEAKRIAEAGEKRQGEIGTGGWNLEISCLGYLVTLDDQDVKTPPPTTVRCYMLALQSNRMGFAAVAVDATTGEVVYWCRPD